MSTRLGALWEKRLNAWHSLYRTRGHAWVRKAHPPTISKNGRLVRAGTAHPDYYGTLKGGRSVVFESKATGKERWPLSEVKKHQARDLSREVELGGIAFVALFSSRSQVGWVLMWEDIRGRKSLTMSEAAEIGREFCPKDGWLPCL